MSNTPNLRYRGHIVRQHFEGRGRNDQGNNCMKPSRDAGTVQDFRDLHRDEMRSRKVHRYTRQINVRGPWYWKIRKNTDSGGRKPTYSANRDYLKSIWPDGKTVNAGRMLNGR